MNENEIKEELVKLSNESIELGMHSWVYADYINVMDGKTHPDEFYEDLEKQIAKLTERIKILQDAAGEQ